MNQIKQAMRAFAKEEDGAQIVEYSLIIAVVSIALVLALKSIAGTNMTDFITRVSNCLTGTCT